jgi:hypothetical protein
MPPHDVARRIQKLRALALDQEGTPEGEAAARLVRRMMFHQARDQAARRYRGLPDADPMGRRKMNFGGPERWRRRLSAAVARHVGCVAAWPSGRGHAWLFGHHSANEVADYLYEVLRRELETACGRWLRDDAPMLSLEEARADPDDQRRRSSFCQSAVAAIDARLSELRDREDGEDPTGTALVLDRRRAVDEWMKAEGIDLKSPSQRPWRYSPDGYLAGYRMPLLDAVTTEPTQTTG